MKIAIVGYGKMGKEIEKCALQKGIEIASIIDPAKIPSEKWHKEIDGKSMKNADVAIDFTTPETAIENLRKVAAQNKNMVMATTGWYQHMDEARKIVRESGIGFIYSSNFSIGVNAYFRIIENAAKTFNKLDHYDVYGYELHHNQKADSPSGTARSAAEILEKNIDRKTKIVYDKADRKISPDELHYASVRAGSIPGTHVAGFDSEADTIEIKHTARSRSGFAQGAVLAAQWVKGRKGFFTINDFMDDFFR